MFTRSPALNSNLAGAAGAGAGAGAAFAPGAALLGIEASFAVRELRLKQDVVPGLENRLHFTASKEGDYELPCMEICGLGHYQMHSMLQVKSDADFQQWVKESAPQPEPAPEAAAAAPAAQ